MSLVKHRKAFGIIEVLISATIIGVIIFALTAAGRASVNGSIYQQQRGQAVFLAQEGLEIVRQIRDSNWIDQKNDTKWNYLSFGTTSLLAPVTPGCYKLDFKQFDIDGTTVVNRYGLSNWLSCLSTLPTPSTEDINLNDSIFNRQVKLESVENLLPNNIPAEPDTLRGNAIKVTVIVKWSNHSVELSELITNWRPDY